MMLDKIHFDKGIYEATLYMKAKGNSDYLLNAYTGVKTIVFKYDGISKFVTELRTGEKIPIIFIRTNTNAAFENTKVKLPLKEIEKYSICVFFQTYHEIGECFANRKYYRDYFYYEAGKCRRACNLLFGYWSNGRGIDNVIKEYLHENADKEKLQMELEAFKEEGQKNFSNKNMQFYAYELDRRQDNWSDYCSMANDQRGENYKKYYTLDYQQSLEDIDIMRGSVKVKSKIDDIKKVISKKYVI